MIFSALDSTSARTEVLVAPASELQARARAYPPSGLPLAPEPFLELTNENSNSTFTPFKARPCYIQLDVLNGLGGLLRLDRFFANRIQFGPPYRDPHGPPRVMVLPFHR